MTRPRPLVRIGPTSFEFSTMMRFVVFGVAALILTSCNRAPTTSGGNGGRGGTANSAWGGGLTAFDRFYFSLHFKHKRNLPACDVQFVPKYRPAGLSAPLRQMPPVRDALPHLSGRIGFDGLHFGVTITLRRI
jgi:hypothetical protein